MERRHNLKAAGRWLGLLAVLLAPPVLFGSQLLAVHRSAQERTECRANLVKLCRALQMYSCDFPKGEGDAWGKYLPTADYWTQAVALYFRPEETPWCPTVTRRRGPGAGGYAFNATLSGGDPLRPRSASRTPLLWEAPPGVLAAEDVLATLPDPPRHVNGTNNIVFLDGHVVTWNPHQAREWVRGRY